MLSFRQKIFFSYVLGFIIFLILLFPLSNILVRHIVTSAMENRSQELIARIKNAPNNETLVRLLKDQKPLMFFRVSVITQDRKVLYDSHTKRLLGPRFSQEYIVDHSEVNEAFEQGRGYHEDWSDLLGQKFAYFAVAFDFHGKKYVLRTAFPFRYVNEIQSDFQLGFLTLATLVLILFSLMSWIIIIHFTKPIQRIIAAVKPYQDGLTDKLPYINLTDRNPKDDFNQLAHTLNSLSSQIQQQINTLKKAAEEKEILLEMKKDFIANASHELKTPITIIRGFAETLHDNPSLPVPLTIDITSKIVRNCERMSHLIKDLLALSDVENLPSARIQEFDLRDVLEKAKSMTLELYKEASITIHCAPAMMMEGYPELIEMAVFNLVNNAAKYSLVPARIELSVEKNEGSLILTVQDHGIGIPLKEQDKIFERFYRISRKTGGSGLGLSIVKTIVEKHFGTISVSSEEEKGSLFTVTFPEKR